MMRERGLKVALVLVGLLFVAALYPMIQFHLSEELQMMLSIYVTLGVFLLLAVRNPSAHRSLIAFAAWSSYAHGGVMAVQSVHDVGERVHLLVGVALFVAIGLVLVALRPTGQAKEMAGAAGA